MSETDTTTTTTPTDTVIDISHDTKSDSKESTPVEEKKEVKEEVKSVKKSINVWWEGKSESMDYDPDTSTLSLVIQSIKTHNSRVTEHRQYGLCVRNHLNEILPHTTKLSECLKDDRDLELVRFRKGSTDSALQIKVICSGWLERKAKDSKKSKKYYFLIKKGSN